MVSTDPGGGENILRDGTVTAVLSQGPERHEVPALRGMSLDAAQGELDRTSLAYGDATYRFSETVAKGVVLSSDPKPGTDLKRGAAVDLVVSKGQRPIKVTDYTGKDADAATKALKKLGFDVDRSAEENSDTVAEGDVISQSPSDGTLVKGDTVKLVVSKGPVLVEVPKVEGSGHRRGDPDARGGRLPGEDREDAVLRRPGVRREPEPGRRRQGPEGQHDHDLHRLTDGVLRPTALARSALLVGSPADRPDRQDTGRDFCTTRSARPHPRSQDRRATCALHAPDSCWLWCSSSWSVWSRRPPRPARRARSTTRSPATAALPTCRRGSSWSGTRLKTLQVTAYGTFGPRRIDRVDLVFSTWGYARCWDLRSTQPHRLGRQDHVLYSVHCGSFRTVRCPGARIYADPGRRFFRFSVPQACLGRPAMVRGSVSFEETSRHLFNQADFTFVVRG